MVASLGLSIWIQPFLAGPFVDIGNISRLTVISMPTILVAFLIVFRELRIQNINAFLVITLLIISSFHHNYSIFFNNFFEYKNIHFALMSIFLNLVIFIIFIKSKP